MRIIAYEELDESFYEYEEMEEIEVVKQILNEVKNNGDETVKQYSEKFDKIKLKNLEVSKDEIREAYQQVDKATVEALKKAARNIRFFAKKQMALFRDFETNRSGAVLGQRIIPIEIIGCYVPGGRYPLPSSALMSIIPAKVARVKEVVVCSPKIAPVTIVAADMAGADRIFNIGGIQAIGAMAYGTETVPKVDKITGPGNKYVAAAKKEVYGTVGIDFIAGPSEVLIIADETANPVFIALDLLAQAEHDTNAKPNLITTSGKLAEEVNKQLETQLNRLRTGDVAKFALKNGRIILADSLDVAVEIGNKIAPEHLELQVKNPKQLMKKLRNYGSLFIGKYSAEVFGDYCSGTNHILPTNRAARYSGGLSVKDFIKILTYQQIDQRGADKLAEIGSKLAEIEGLEAHRKSAEIRST